MSDAQIIVFHDDDAGYEEWVSRHGGYVLTRRREAAYMLHHADCVHLGRDGDLSLKLTKRPRRWARERQPLIEWTQVETGSDPLRCQSCM